MDSADVTRRATAEYMEKHRLQELFAHLTQLVVYHQPEDPRAFLTEEIRKIQANGGKPEGLFTEDDLSTMFDIIDATNQGTISVEQLRRSCVNLAQGNDGSAVDEDAIKAAADANGRVGREGFKRVLGAQLRSKHAWTPK